MARKRKKPSITKPVPRPRMPLGIMLRMFLLGSISVVAAGYAIYRHYAVPRPSMLQPVPDASVAEPEPLPSGVLPAPELVPVDR